MEITRADEIEAVARCRAERARAEEAERRRNARITFDDLKGFSSKPAEEQQRIKRGISDVLARTMAGEWVD